MEGQTELFVLASPEVEDILADNGINLEDLLKREGCAVKEHKGQDPAKLGSGEKDVAIIILASAALVAALTPILSKAIQSLTYKDVVVYETVLVPVEDSAGNVVRDSSGEPKMQWIRRSKLLESTRDKGQQEIKIKALGFEIEITNTAA
ncbi:hypothetical protein H6F98_12755 [Microcoleus sp. FACHB-SPT15]|uniref:hypothetical protein n=1 Tax=Microcoleus sp. FACHB-SPT15 TaxID=2692830 RepID=UPI00177E3A56|nr:hypothetical protein [Microcoleus sp. FACHB-SPT15]MBD1806316.1 hypothetical protein [Microcoleus sp. FACHB-SPT15]